MVESISKKDTPVYSVISFAPVQGFIEKSRKLRDLYGASQILSYLSAKIVSHARAMDGVEVISPSSCADDSDMDIIQGMPNRILLQGKFSYNDATNAVAEGWNEILSGCKSWIEERDDLSTSFDFTGEGWRRAWTKWKINAWEIFWGEGATISAAMLALETNKLRRDWTVPNWNGESSTLSGADAIAYPNMDSMDNVGSRYDQGLEREEIREFYQELAQALQDTTRTNDPVFLDPTEWLSIPELIKRLVTHHEVSRRIDRVAGRDNGKPLLYVESFSELLRMNDTEQESGGYWTGWFMGDGDQVGNHLKTLTTSEDVVNFSQALRTWGRGFQQNFQLGRVVYAGGDDFMGVMYGTDIEPQRNGLEILNSLIDLQKNWESGGLGINLSVGFVWAGHSVPQRDVLQHCREAEKEAKKLGRDRLTIRILFNNGQYVQWTTPWKYLGWLMAYRDRCSPERKTGSDANWNHVYSDLAELKARHAIPPKTPKDNDPNADVVALSLLGFYFGEEKRQMLSRQRKMITGSENTGAVICWIEGMIGVGWQLCSNS